MFYDFWPVLPVKVTISFSYLMVDANIFFTVTDKHMCPYCESIQWWFLDVQVHQDVFWKTM